MKSSLVTVLVFVGLMLGFGVETHAAQADSYTCEGENTFFYDKFDISVKGNLVIEVTEYSGNKPEKHRLKLDPSYKPHAEKNKVYRRFDGDLSFVTGESYAIDFFVHQNLLAGKEEKLVTGSNGKKYKEVFLKITARGESFETGEFHCTKN